ncbi:hypothetical protein Cs7R123_00600 [Catellatospora sp. TT07R-123]|uniref:hypothetical protein n=1 Tax=Catellatospora sp. TT07R-123 TaxID=2733863 RepID=UPI001B138670|nr:hypothetical protein [Catellatospora sp. TT07R-123]GHJ42718.1 hypothetical protein Cs7R123_00600 [Catellatospora sp. TT07R-123]
MGTDSAITEHLTAYADRCTPADEGLRDLVTGQLRPAILNFFSQNTPKDDGQNVDLSALKARLGGVCTVVSVDARLLAQANDAARLDAWVKQIGRAFEIAGSQGPVSGPVAPGQTRPVVRTADPDVLADLAAHLPSMDAGKELAAKAKEGANDPKTIKWVSEQLGLHGGDPYYLAAVFNNLDPNDLARLLRDPANGSLLAYAFAKNLITPEAAKKIIEAISHVSGGYEISPEYQYLPADARNALLQYLAADPAAARNFLAAIGPDGWKKLFNLYAGQPVPGSHDYPLRVFKVVLDDTSDPKEVARLLDQLADSLPGNVDEAEFKQFEPLLKQLLTTNIPKLLGPVPPFGEHSTRDMQDWINRFAIELDRVKKFSDWAEQHYKDAGDRKKLVPDLIFGILLELGGGKITETLTEKLGGTKAAEMLADELTGLIPTDKLQEWLDKNFEPKPGDDYDPHKYSRIAALTTIVYSLVAQKRIKLGGKPVTWEQLQNDEDFKKMIEAFADNRPPEDKDKVDEAFKKRRGLLQWAQKYDLDTGTLYTAVITLDENLLP